MTTSIRVPVLRWAGTVAASLVLNASTPAQAGLYDTWSYTAPVQFSGYSQAETLANFPALVVLSNNCFAGFAYSQFLSGSNDLAFTADDTGLTNLNYEIDTWNTGGVSYVWVQVPALANNTSLHAWWGSASQTTPLPCSTNRAAWDSGYRGVWHLGVDNNDSTTNANNLSVTVNSPGTVTTNAGPVGNARSVTNNTQGNYLAAANNASLNPSYITVEAWVKATDYSNMPRIVDKVYSSYALLLNDGNGRISAAFNTTSGDYSSFTHTTFVPDGTWHHVAGTYDGTTVKAFVDGQFTSYARSVGTIANNSSDFRIGCRADGTGRQLNGTVDEVRLSSFARSTNWIWAVYMNAMSNGVFQTYGTATGTAYDDTLPVIANAAASNVTLSSASMNGYLSSTGGSATTVSVYWGPTDGGTNGANWANTNTFAQGQWGEGSWPTTNVTGLTSDQNHYYRYQATNASGEAWATSPQYLITGELAIQSPDSLCGTNFSADTATIVISRPGTCVGGSLPLALTLGGTATNNVHYTITPSPASVSISAGQASVTFTITPLKPWNYGSDRTIVLTLNAGPYVLPAANSATVTLRGLTRTPFYWDGPGGKAWDALDNGGSSWWRWGDTNAPFSPVLPDNDDTCYDIKNTQISSGAELGTEGHYAVIHLGNDAALWCGVAGNNPLVIEPSGARLGLNNWGDQVCRGPITLNGTMTVASGRTLDIYSYFSGTGRVVAATGVNTITLRCYTNSYTGGTYMQPDAGMSFCCSSPTYDQDGTLGPGPVDMGNGAAFVPWNTSSRFLNNKSSFYGSAGGTNLLSIADNTHTWEMNGSNVTWRPGPRDGSGVGVTMIYNVANLKCTGASSNGYPTLLFGMKLGGVCDKLLVATNSAKPQLKLSTNAWLSLDNIDPNQAPHPWISQGTTKYVIAELNGSTSDHTVSGRFRNGWTAVDAYTDQIAFSNGYFRSAYITYQGDATTKAVSGGNDILVWNLVPSGWHAGTVFIFK